MVVTSDAALVEVVEAARSGGRVAIDTEFMREKTYYARLCLVQVAVDGRVWLVDPLAGVDLRPLTALVAAPNVEVVVHAGRQDFDIFYEMHGTVPRRVFDVQIAAGFAGLGASLPYGRLVHALCGMEIVKGEAYTDWCRRPLTQAQSRYAADDVRYLLPAADELHRRLDGSGRSGWAREEMSSLESPASYRTDRGELWRRVSGRGTLTRRHLGMLRELAAWREECAAARDLPRGWVVKDATLVEIARRAPRTLEQLKSIRGLSGRAAERWGRDIIAAVERGRGAPPPETGSAPARGLIGRARAVAGLADAVVRARCEGAGIAAELVATRAELDALLVDVLGGGVRPERHRLLTGWRRALAGDAVVALARGRIAVRASDSPPYIEELDVSKEDVT